ncbi:hypothetical protein MRB53_039579 [Persea americana]|nr:hypothetical protein MRB53_039579 [Persea americana]
MCFQHSISLYFRITDQNQRARWDRYIIIPCITVNVLSTSSSLSTALYILCIEHIASVLKSILDLILELDIVDARTGLSIRVLTVSKDSLPPSRMLQQ